MAQRGSPSAPEGASGVAQVTVLGVPSAAPRSLTGRFVTVGLILLILAGTAGVMGGRQLSERLTAGFEALYEPWAAEQQALEETGSALTGVRQQLEQWAALDQPAPGLDTSGVLVVSRAQVAHLADQLGATVGQLESMRRLTVQRQSVVGQVSEEVRRDAQAVLWAAVVGLWAAWTLGEIWLGRSSVRPAALLRQHLELSEQSRHALEQAVGAWFGRVRGAVRLQAQAASEHRSELSALAGRVQALAAAHRKVQDHTGSLLECAQQLPGTAERVRDFAEESRLLALAASMEAARLDAGAKSVGVVAEEIRRLAAQARAMTAELGQLRRQVSEAVQQVYEASRALASEAQALEAGLQAAASRSEALAAALEGLQEPLQAVATAATGRRGAPGRSTLELRAAVDRALSALVEQPEAAAAVGAEPGAAPEAAGAGRPAERPAGPERLAG